MFLYASSFHNATLKTLSGQNLGKISFVAIDMNIGKVVGLVLERGLINKQVMAVSPSRIFEVGGGEVVIRSEDDLDPIKEIVRVEKAWRENLDFFGMQALTESGTKLGSLKDMLLDQQGFYIHRFYLVDGGNERILSRDLLVEVKDRKLFFKDEALNRPNLSPIEDLKNQPKPVLA